jgi:hypothetical protein
MNDLVRLFEEELKKSSIKSTSHDEKAMMRLYHSIKEILTNIHGYVDLESAFSVLKTVSEGARYSDLGFASTYAITKLGIDAKEVINTKDEIIAATKLIRKYKNFVRRKCQIRNSIETLITKIYSDLFDKLRPKFSFETCVGRDGRAYVYPRNSSIYTTNYDRVVETYWEGIAEINDLWKTEANTQILNTELQKGDMLNFIKLHGSLDWFGLDDGEIVKSDTLKPTYGKRKVKGS